MHSRVDRAGDDPRLAELIRHLRELPLEERPPCDWATFSERASRASGTRAWRPDWRHASLAAGAACVLLALAMWTRFAAPGMPVARTSAEAAPPASEPHWLRPDIAAGWLEVQRAEPAIVRADTHLGVMYLEDSIAWVDELITLERTGEARPVRVRELERERSRLVDSLIRVRYAETLAAELD